MTTSLLGAAALATELADLVNLPGEQRGPAEGDRYDEVRWALADIDPSDRMAAYAAAVAAIDPNHLAGPYPDPETTVMTVELYAFEKRRLDSIYHTERANRSDVANRLLVVVEPIYHSLTANEMFAYSHVRTLLTAGHITTDNFPGFTLRGYLRETGTDLVAFDAQATSYADWLAAVTHPLGT